MAGKAGGFNVTVAVPDLVLSATLVAVTVTVCATGTELGAVYKPVAEIEPAPLGAIVQVTAVLSLLVTVAVNCCVDESNRLAVGGVTFTETGLRVTAAEADFEGSATLVAVTVTVCEFRIKLGAV